METGNSKKAGSEDSGQAETLGSLSLADMAEGTMSAPPRKSKRQMATTNKHNAFFVGARSRWAEMDFGG